MPKLKTAKERKTSEPVATENTPLVARNSSESDEIRDSQTKAIDGLSVRQAALLLAGEMAGGGVLALPRAFVKTGWVGVPILVVLCGVAAFNGNRLGDCWSLLEEQETQLRTRKRNPYAIIAHNAFGKSMGIAVSLAFLFTLLGVGVVFLLLASQLLETVLLILLPTLSLCYWYLIVAALATPLVLFGTYKEFPHMGIISFAATLGASALYFTQMMIDIRPFVFRYGIHGFQDFFIGIAIFMFNLSGIATFPTIQNDMNDRSKFTKSLQYSFIAILIVYLTLGITGYAVYGEGAGANFATSLSATPVTLAANILMIVHLVSAFIILINPVCQEMEELYDISRDSTGLRVAVRVSVIAAILFLGETIPRFYTILAVVGATSVALLTFVLPPACYIRLYANDNSQNTTCGISPKLMRRVCWHIVAVAAVLGVFATFTSINSMFNTEFTLPCYLK